MKASTSGKSRRAQVDIASDRARAILRAYVHAPYGAAAGAVGRALAGLNPPPKAAEAVSLTNRFPAIIQSQALAWYSSPASIRGSADKATSRAKRAVDSQDSPESMAGWEDPRNPQPESIHGLREGWAPDKSDSPCCPSGTVSNEELSRRLLAIEGDRGRRALLDTEVFDRATGRFVRRDPPSTLDGKGRAG